MALPWWLRGGLTGGAALLKARLKRIKEGSEVVGKARKVLLAKLTKQLKALKDKKPKDKEPEKPKEKRTMSRKKLMEHGEKEAKREKTKKLRDSTQEEFEEAFKKLKPKTQASVKRYKKATDAINRRKAIGEEDARIRRIRGGGHTRTEHSITGKVKGDTDLRDFGRSLLKQDIRVAKHVKGLQELKKMREMVKSGDLPKHVSKRLAREYGKHTRERVIDPKLAKPAKESFQRIQKKKDRFKKKDAKKKGKQGD